MSSSTLILRLGYTESDLLLTFFMVNHSSNKIDILNNENLKKETENMLNWFYKTSGFYDKTVKQIDITCFFSQNFIDYMNILIKTIRGSTKCFLNLHDYTRDYYQYFGEFVNFLNDKVISIIWYTDEEVDKYYSEYKKYYILNNFIDNKEVLIINPLSDLMYNQYKNKNVYHANNITFSEIKNMIFYKNPYTFLNDGPHNNNIETVRDICNNISKITEKYECAVISCGSYSCLIADYIFNTLKKDVFVIGGTMNEQFALKTQRLKTFFPDLSFNEFWIDIPEYMKPSCYKEIEDGCYW